jgi:hypothetical protein
MKQQETSTLSNQDISSALLAHTYTADADRELSVRVFADQVAGNGNYVAYVTVQRLGAGSSYRVIPVVTAAAAAGVTAVALVFDSVPVKATDVLKVYIVGLVGDTATPDIITEIWDRSALFVSLGAEIRDANLLDQFKKVTAIIEHQRGAHTHQPVGNVFFVDPTNGDTHANGNRGGVSDPYASIQDCHDNAVTDSNHDVIILVAGDSGGATTHTEALTISKRYLFIRGPGRDFVITRSGSGDTITVSADGVELSGFQLNTAGDGVGHGIQCTDADFLRVHNVWINATRGDGINLLRAENCQIHDNYFTDTGQSGAGQGIDILGTGGNSDNNSIYDNHFRDCAGDAIQISGGTTDNTRIYRNLIEGSAGYAIDIGASSTDAFVVDNRCGNNSSGAINDSGTTTVDINNEAWNTVVPDAAGTVPSNPMLDTEDGSSFTALPAVTATLTQSASQVGAALTGSNLVITTADRLSVSFAGVGDISDRTELWFGFKSDRSDDDTEALILVSEGVGLEYINGAAAGTPANGSITVSDEAAGDLVVLVEGAESTKLASLPANAGKVRWSLKVLRSSGALTTLLEGVGSINEGVVQDLS